MPPFAGTLCWLGWWFLVRPDSPVWAFNVDAALIERHASAEQAEPDKTAAISKTEARASWAEAPARELAQEASSVQGGSA